MSKRIETQNSVEREKKDGNTSGGIYTDIAAMEIENGGGGGEDIGTDPKMTPIKSEGMIRDDNSKTTDDEGFKVDCNNCCDVVQNSCSTGWTSLYHNTVKEVSDLQTELYNECIPGFFKEENNAMYKDKSRGDVFIEGLKGFFRFFYVPHFPILHRPGWMLKLFLGPYHQQYWDYFIADVMAGTTVAMTLIPQSLSYANLANQPPINGLYCAVLPSASYVIFGTSMTLAVGPVAIVGLLVGGLVSKYGIETASTEAVDFASEVCIVAGCILIAMSLLNLGNFIRFISHPVMSGFTTAAAMLIGLNQLKGAFGFKFEDGYYPQTGDGHIHYNYEVFKWLIKHFNDTYSSDADDGYDEVKGKSVRNPYAMMICFCIYVPLIINQSMKKRFKPTPERKAKLSYRIWIWVSNLQALIGVIIGALAARHIKVNADDDDWYAQNLKIVGDVPSGLDIMRSPSMKWDFGTLLPDVLPLTLIAFMESYSIAKKTATMRGELHTLSASQELWAIGTSNIMGAFSSGFPVAGSYSRSSINFSAGARSPLSKMTTLILVILALQVMTSFFYYIPYAALSAIIWLGITNLIDVRDFWNAFKYSKKDFFTMVLTFSITLLFETSYGLATGLGVSILMYLSEVSFASHTSPRLVHDSIDNNGIDVVRLEGDLTFLTANRLKDLLMSRTVKGPELLDAENNANNNNDDKATPEQIAQRTADERALAVSNALDKIFPIQTKPRAAYLPSAVVLDFSQVKIIDITGLHSIAEFCVDSRKDGILVALVNTNPSVTASMVKFGLTSDLSTTKVNIDEYVYSRIDDDEIDEDDELGYVEKLSIDGGNDDRSDNNSDNGITLVPYAEVEVDDVEGGVSRYRYNALTPTMAAGNNGAVGVDGKEITNIRAPGMPRPASKEKLNIMNKDLASDTPTGTGLSMRQPLAKYQASMSAAKTEEEQKKVASVSRALQSAEESSTISDLEATEAGRTGMRERTASESEVVIGSNPSTDEKLLATQSYPIHMEDDQGKSKKSSKSSKSSKSGKRTHREKYGIVDGNQLPVSGKVSRLILYYEYPHYLVIMVHY